MRTTNDVQKTENKQIKKTISKTLAIVLSLVLISFTVSAQGFWKQILTNNTYGKMAELMVEQKNADDRAQAPKPSILDSAKDQGDQPSEIPYLVWPEEVSFGHTPNQSIPWFFVPNKTK